MASYHLIGHPLGHSLSPRLHALLGNPDYSLMDLDASELDAFMKGRAFDGLNVTIPYKQSVMPYLDEISEKALGIGAVNTVVRRGDGSLYGDNTDFAGFMSMADHAGVSFEGKVVLILGSGGTSKTAWYAAQASGAAKIYRVSRSGPVHYENVYRVAENAQILINTTPVGMYPHAYDPLLIDLSRLPKLEAVLDVVYRPLRTRLTLEAEKRGLLYVGGLRMLVEQACAAEELFTGRPVDEAEAERILKILTREQVSLILVGMPGSGKSSVGRLLSRALNRPFLDTDSMIVQKARMEIPAIFEQFGESGFRDRETEALQEACLQGGSVSATGGGAVLREENRDIMRMNGYVCLIDRSVDSLDRSGRPLSQSARVLAKMREARMPYYQALSDAVFENNTTLENLAKAILEDFHAHFGTERTESESPWGS